MTCAPIVLFVYNRPWHTQQTIEALQKNELADQSELFIFSDGPKNENDAENILKVRVYIKTITGFKNITIIEKIDNRGLADSIISGVTDIVNRYGKIIVVEDDLVSSPFFLKYMNDALNIYENDNTVMHIAAYMYPLTNPDLPETFFYRASSCWGWGTWARAWKFFNPDIQDLIKKFDRKMIYDFTINGTMDFWNQMEILKRREINSWAIRWYASVFIKHGLCLHPSKSLIKNTGFDGTGIHCGATDMFDVSVRNQPISFFESEIKENKLALKEIQKFLKRVNPSKYQKMYRKIQRFLKRWIEV
jgi:GT2 family glycosyltransferase